jgi:hypothetical protein
MPPLCTVRRFCKAQRRELDALMAHLEALANGHDDTRVEVAGNMAGAWFASPATRQGHELIAAGLLLIAGPVDRDVLLRAVRTAMSDSKAGCRPRPGFRPSWAESCQLLLARETCLTKDEFGLEQGRPIVRVDWASGARVSPAPFDKLTGA